MVSAISKCKPIKSCQDVPLSREKDTVYIASSSPPKNPIKNPQFLHAMSIQSKNLSKFDKVNILSQNFWLIFTYSTAAVAQLYVFKYTKVRLFIILTLELSCIERFPKSNILFPLLFFFMPFKNWTISNASMNALSRLLHMHINLHQHITLRLY